MAIGLAAASAKAKDKRMKFKPGDTFPAKTTPMMKRAGIGSCQTSA